MAEPEGSRKMAELSRLLVMGLGIAVALLGLFLASRAHDNAVYIAGLALFVFGVGLNFHLIILSIGRRQD